MVKQPGDVQYMFEALKVLWEWSRALLVLESALVAALPLLLRSRDGASRKWLSAALGAFLASTFVALNVLGVIPWLIQQLPELAKNTRDIYQLRNYFGVPLVVLATAQHVTFAVGFFCLGVAAFTIVHDPKFRPD